MHEPLSEVNSLEAILFVGSGFSRGAKNIRGEFLPTGDELKIRFANLLEADPNKYDLKTLADEVAERDELDLYQIVYQTFTVSQADGSQIDVLKVPWRRIYTTNFDDLIEFVMYKHKKR